MNLGAIHIVPVGSAFLKPLPACAFLLLPHMLCLGSLGSCALGLVSTIRKMALKMAQWYGHAQAQVGCWHFRRWRLRQHGGTRLTCVEAAHTPSCSGVVSAWSPAFCSLAVKKGRQWKWGVRVGGDGEGGRSEEDGSTAWPNCSLGESEEKAGVSRGGSAQPHEVSAITW